MMGNWVKKGKDAMSDTFTSFKKIIYEDPVNTLITIECITPMNFIERP